MSDFWDAMLRRINAEISCATLQRGGHIDAMPQQPRLPPLRHPPVLVNSSRRYDTLRMLIGTAAFAKRFSRRGNMLWPEDHVNIREHARRWPQ